MEHTNTTLELLQEKVREIHTQISTLPGKAGHGSMALAECSVLMAHMAGLIDACRTLAARVAVLEQRPAVSYMGVWEMGKSYQPGQFVTHGGSLWACHEPTSGKPGTSPGWQLAAKRGRDGKGTAQLERKCS